MCKITPQGGSAGRPGRFAFPGQAANARPGLATNRSVIYRFGEYSVDDKRLELRRGSRTLEVQPKVLDLLIYLVRERERVVSRRELLDRLWGDAEVVEAVLTTAVHDYEGVVPYDYHDRAYTFRVLPTEHIREKYGSILIPSLWQMGSTEAAQDGLAPHARDL